MDPSALAQTAAPAAPPQRAERVRFCTRCGATADEPEAQVLSYGFDRVCARCGMGVMLSTPGRAILAPGAAFLVLTREALVSAVSEAAEQLVGSEEALMDTPVTRSITSPEGDDLFVRAIARAAGGRRDVAELPVVAASPAAARLGPLAARIASCGPPRAALLVIERTTA